MRSEAASQHKPNEHRGGSYQGKTQGGQRGVSQSQVVNNVSPSYPPQYPHRQGTEDDTADLVYPLRHIERMGFVQGTVCSETRQDLVQVVQDDQYQQRGGCKGPKVGLPCTA